MSDLLRREDFPVAVDFAIAVEIDGEAIIGEICIVVPRVGNVREVGFPLPQACQAE
jgi:hypothetical protein